MKKIITTVVLSGVLSSVLAQEPILDSWILNTDGTLASYWESD